MKDQKGSVYYEGFNTGYTHGINSFSPPLSENPYEEGTVDFYSWEEGYDEGFDEGYSER